MISVRPINELLKKGWIPPSGEPHSELERWQLLAVSQSAATQDFETVVTAPSPSTIVGILRDEPFENGAPHPLDEAFAVALGRDPSGLSQAVTAAWDLETVRRPDLLLLLARLPEHLAVVALLPFVRRALCSERRSERDAAIRVLEAWGSSDARNSLEAHVETDPRLADYLRRVLEGMTRQRSG